MLENQSHAGAEKKGYKDNRVVICIDLGSIKIQLHFYDVAAAAAQQQLRQQQRLQQQQQQQLQQQQPQQQLQQQQPQQQQQQLQLKTKEPNSTALQFFTRKAP